MKLHPLGLVLLLIVAPVAANCTMLCITDVRIPNESALPPGRLADALATDGIISSDQHQLRRAAELAPSDPRYWYLLATSQSLLSTPRVYRMRLERALAADPAYLPALYPYLMTKPTHEQRMGGLQRCAALDSDNAKPYYLMAIDLYKSFTADRHILAVSGGMAYPMTAGEWDSVLQLIRKGNGRPRLEANLPGLPATTDFVLEVSGKPVVPDDLKAYVSTLVSAYLACGNVSEMPAGVVSSTWSRQLALQALWEAKSAEKQGRRSEALAMLDAVNTMGGKWATARPYRYSTLMTGCALRTMAAHARRPILKASGESVALSQIDSQAAIWKRILAEGDDMAGRLYRILESDACMPRYQETIAAEEAAVARHLRELGLAEATGR